MIKVSYTEPDGPAAPALRLEAAGHAGYAPAGQDIVCAGASVLMQGLVYLLAGAENVHADVWDEPEGPRIAVTAAAPREAWVEGAFELAKAGFALLAERYPEHLRYSDTSRRAERSMLDLQLFAEGGEGGAVPGGDAGGSAPAAPALSRAQQRQAVASGTLPHARASEISEPTAASAAPAPSAPQRVPAQPAPQPAPPPKQNPSPLPPLRAQQQNALRALHARWAAEEAMLRQSEPDFSLRQELKNPEMRRLMRMPGMRVQDAYRLAHYDEALRRAAQTVEQGVLERVRQRAARPAENGARPGGAAVTRPDVSRMTRAQREALERQALHGARIQF